MLILLALLASAGCQQPSGVTENTSPDMNMQPSEEDPSFNKKNPATTYVKQIISTLPLERFVIKEDIPPETLWSNDVVYYRPPAGIPVKRPMVSTDGFTGREEATESRSLINPRKELPYKSFYKYQVAGESHFSIIFDNDIFSNTDYYYTSGLSFELVHPVFSALPTARLLLSAGRGSMNHYSLRLTQTLFTPIDPDKVEIQPGDRPFASYLVLGHQNTSNQALKKLRVTSRLDLGVIGPAAMGGVIQKTMHDIEPAGWQNQLSNDLVVNYSLGIEKGLALGENLEMIGTLDGQAGTLYNELSAGAGLRLSNGGGYFESIFLSSRPGSGKGRIHYFTMLSLDGTLVGYDATLQGGPFTRAQNVYSLAPGEISRGVFHSRVSAGISYRKFSMEAEHHFLSREFEGGKSHMWSRIRTVFSF